MGIDKLVRSKGYKNFMAKLYGWGAAVVILGSLFKIMHYPGAGVMLLAGMGTEALIFFMSAFEPLHVEYNWSLVYPELAAGDDMPETPTSKKDKKQVPQGTVSQQLDRMLEDAKIGPELIESLASGMRNLSENAKKLSGVSDAATVTDNYVGNLTKAAESVRNLSLQYEKTISSLQNSEQYLSSINSIYQLQKDMLDNLNSSLDNTRKYKEEIDKLTQNVAKLSSVYGNMLSAMNINK